MSSLKCNKCNNTFKNKSSHTRHMNRKTSCVKTKKQKNENKTSLQIEESKNENETSDNIQNIQAEKKPSILETHQKVKYIDLFCGMGSFHYSFKKFGFECVMASDISNSPIAIASPVVE